MKYLLILFCSFNLISVAAHGAEVTRPRQIYFDLDTRFTFVDRPHVPNPGVGDKNLFDLTAATRPRTLGLSKMRLDALWQSSELASLNIVLRPDALLAARQVEGDEVVRDFDTRAGDVYQKAAPIEILDAYQLSLHPGTALTIAGGVWESLTPYRTSYSPILKFGLLTLFPEKFLGVTLSWYPTALSAPTTQDQAPGGWFMRLTGLQGSGDRGETLASNEASHDVAPSSSDHQLGAALYVGWQRLDRLEAGLLVGQVSEPSAEGSSRSLIFDAIGVVDLKTAKFPTKVSVDIRRVQQTWKNDAADLSPLTQQSVSLTASVKVLEHDWILAGMHNGASGRHANGLEEKYTGQQLDFGFLHAVDNSLDLQLMLSHEFRKLQDYNGDMRGGFGPPLENLRHIQRIGFEIKYILDDNA